MIRRSTAGRGFSLIEVLLALGLASFALMSLLVLLPVGMKTNQTSVEEARADDLLSVIEADLRNSSTPTGKSLLFGLTAPYYLTNTVSGRLSFNPAALVSTNLINGATTVGLSNNDSVVSIASLPRFQASVVYTAIPTNGALRPIQARLIVNWPCRNLTDPQALTSLTNVSGYVEAYVTFPSP